MHEFLTEKLKNEIGTVEWTLLKPHADRGVLLIISPQLDLLDVAVQVAKDRVKQISQWLASGKITRPTPNQLEEWKTGETIFTGVIVHPFVLIQLPA